MIFPQFLPRIVKSLRSTIPSPLRSDAGHLGYASLSHRGQLCPLLCRGSLLLLPQQPNVRLRCIMYSPAWPPSRIDKAIVTIIQQGRPKGTLQSRQIAPDSVRQGIPMAVRAGENGRKSARKGGFLLKIPGLFGTSKGNEARGFWFGIVSRLSAFGRKGNRHVRAWIATRGLYPCGPSISTVSVSIFAAPWCDRQGVVFGVFVEGGRYG